MSRNKHPFSNNFVCYIIEESQLISTSFYTQFIACKNTNRDENDLLFWKKGSCKNIKYHLYHKYKLDILKLIWDKRFFAAHKNIFLYFKRWYASNAYSSVKLVSLKGCCIKGSNIFYIFSAHDKFNVLVLLW